MEGAGTAAPHLHKTAVNCPSSASGYEQMGVFSNRTDLPLSPKIHTHTYTETHTQLLHLFSRWTPTTCYAPPLPNVQLTCQFSLPKIQDAICLALTSNPPLPLLPVSFVVTWKSPLEGCLSSTVWLWTPGRDHSNGRCVSYNKSAVLALRDTVVGFTTGASIRCVIIYLGECCATSSLQCAQSEGNKRLNNNVSWLGERGC